MEYPEEQWLMLSGLQHFAFCRRQWALIHLEQAWQENLQTAEGMLMHRRAHDAGQAEMHGGRLTLRGLSVHSARLGVSGACDVVEFTPSPAGVPLAGPGGNAVLPSARRGAVLWADKAAGGSLLFRRAAADRTRHAV